MKKTIRDFDLENKKVIIRCDFNVPLKDGKIADDTRIKRSLETIQYALEKKAKVILLSHLGRVKTEEDKEKNNLKVVADRLRELLPCPITFVPKTRGEEVEKAIASMNPSEVVLLQNTRYEDLDGKKESGCDDELSRYWASLGDIFINDAFGTLHRAHASNAGISKYLDSGIGFLVEKEVNALSTLFDPERPFVIILGGAKVADKIGLIQNLISKCDKMLIGGGMAFTFLKAEGYEVGNSLVDQDSLSFCQNILKDYGNKIILPVDVRCSREYSNDTPYEEKDITKLDFDDMGLDLGKNSITLFQNHLKDAKMVLWNGPLGVYEFSNYQKGTQEILSYLKEHREQIKTVLGGGDIVAAANQAGVADSLYHVATGGGATLEFLEGKEMPGLINIKEG